MPAKKIIMLTQKFEVYVYDLLVPSADNLCKQLGPRSCATKCWTSPESKLFDMTI